MKKNNRSSISKSNSYEQIGEFWDSHDLTEFVGKTKKINFDIGIKNDKTYCALDKTVSNKLRLLANKRGVSPDVLANLLLQEKLQSLKPKKSN